ncbi:MAG: hypothetical protein CSYNP_00264 [Syntrophus sp. SKADARSKE-3]|nr:hypothetical protein [Syntrophus sp. SKADARSKE-3]
MTKQKKQRFLVLGLLSVALIIASPVRAGQIQPNPNNGTIDTDLTIPYSSDWNSVNFTDNGTINLNSHFSNNSTFNNNGTVWVNFIDLTVTNSTGAVFNNNSGGVVEQWAGPFTNQAGATLNNSGQFKNSNVVKNYGSLTNNAGGYLWNGGVLNNYAGGSITNNGTYEGWVLNVYGGTVDNNSTWQNRGSLINYGGTFNNNIGATLTNYDSGNISNRSTFNNAGTIINSNGRTLENFSGTFTNSGTITNAGILTNKAAAIFANTGILTNNGSLTNAGTINNTGTFTLALGSTYNFTGGTLNNTGTFTLNRDFTFGAAQAGTINLNAGGTLQNYATLTNDEGYNQNNAGSIVNNANATFINNGILSGSGSIINAGLLKGSGTIMGSTTNRGTIAPGNSIGTLTIAGNYTHTAGAIYQVEVNAAGQSDKLNITGTATLLGGTVAVLPQAGIYNMNTRYTILTAGNVTGTFNNVTFPLTFLTPSLSYDPTSVYLLLVRNSTSFADVAATENQRVVASGLDRLAGGVTGDMETVLNNLLNLSTAGARGAYDQLGGFVHTAVPDV